jgi:hypothetical protein
MGGRRLSRQQENDTMTPDFPKQPDEGDRDIIDRELARQNGTSKPDDKASEAGKEKTSGQQGEAQR